MSMMMVTVPRVRLLLAAAMAAVLLGAPDVAHAGWFLPEQRLSTNAQRWPEVSGTRVVFEDYRNRHDVGDVNDPTTLYDIRVLDLKTMHSKNLTPYHTAVGRPAMSGDRVVWGTTGTGRSKAASTTTT